MSPVQQFNLGASRGNIWIQDRAAQRMGQRDAYSFVAAGYTRRRAHAKRTKAKRTKAKR